MDTDKLRMFFKNTLIDSIIVKVFLKFLNKIYELSKGTIFIWKNSLLGKIVLGIKNVINSDDGKGIWVVIYSATLTNLSLFYFFSNYRINTGLLVRVILVFVITLFLLKNVRINSIYQNSLFIKLIKRK